jgi:two-component system, OmpR family, sensor histidine kinase VicK
VWRLETINGDSNVLNAFLNFISKADVRIDACVVHTRPALAIDINKVRNSILDAKRRGVRIRCITEIVKENLSSCKDLHNIVDELRHIDGIKGTFYVYQLT